MAQKATEEPMEIVREAFDAFFSQDVPRLRQLVDPNLEWTYLNPEFADPSPVTCHGFNELRKGVDRWSAMGVTGEVERIEQHGNKVLVVIHAPGLDAFRARKADDRNFHVVTITNGVVRAMRACRNVDEALAFATAP